ncbi:MAG: hypothetical protein IJ017_02915 [Oscillospiraceae bacterium]|nr:hypothetical protein [Oscillospiraceae bacterium]
MSCINTQNFKTYCIQIITTTSVYQIDLRADLGVHSISDILSHCANCYYDQYLQVFQERLAALSIDYTHLSYREYPTDFDKAWELSSELAYPACNALIPYNKSLGDPDELYLLMNITKKENEDSSCSHILSLKAVKQDLSVKTIFQSSYMYYGDDRNDSNFDIFEIAVYHTGDETRHELVHSRTMAMTPFNDRLILILSNIDTLETARQVTHLLGYDN